MVNFLVSKLNVLTLYVLAVMERHGLRELTFIERHRMVIIYDVIMLMVILTGCLGFYLLHRHITFKKL